ncbi:POM121 transmembrane nucleoporin like 2 [Rhinolophus ferrumequinum]|uniref:POM121 transmembrane nucleoporin like 2 n=1 Tax=Rhinolophus ferrumequinum TaxID=59479 RepID=A0A7J7SYI3_RHIFE|nr:POM121 transmembrane nucleoporin like 2 [Rhinolophus ferrumequinum]
MGSNLGKPGRPPRAPAGGRAKVPRRPVNRRPVQSLHQVHRVQYVHRAHPAPRLRPWRRRQTWDAARPTVRVVGEDGRRFPIRRPQDSIVGPLPSALWESYWNFRIWSPRQPRAPWSPVTIKISPPEQRGVASKSPAQISSVESSPSEKPPGPCAKETVLRALRECKKGRVRTQEPLFPEGLHSEKSPDTKPSAFKPLVQNGVCTSFVPRPGSLKRSLDAGSSDHNLHKRPSRSSVSSWVSTQTGGPCSSKRNAITSSYSSSRGFSERWKRSVPRASFQMPEWPIKKKEKGHQHRSPVPLVSEESPAASGCTRQQNQKTPWLLSSPASPPTLTSPPQLGGAVPKGDLGLKKAGVQQGHETRKDATEVTTASVHNSWSPVPPCLALTLPPAGAAPTQGTNPQVGSPGLLAFPPAGEGSSVAPPPPKTPSLLAPLGCSRSEPLPGPSSDTKPTAAVTLLNPASPISPVTDTTQPPVTSQADWSARTPDPRAITPAALSTQRTLFGKVKKPAGHHSTPASPATTSADLMLKCIWGPPTNGETADTSHPRILVTAVAPPPLSTVTPTFKPVFGGTGPLTTLPVTAPFTFKLAFPPAPPASTHAPHGLPQAASAVMSTAPFSFKQAFPPAPPASTHAPHGLPQAASAVMSTAPFSFKQAFPPAPPASTHAPHGLPQAASAVMSTAPFSFKQAFPPAPPASTQAPHGLPQAASAVMSTAPFSFKQAFPPAPPASTQAPHGLPQAGSAVMSTAPFSFKLAFPPAPPASTHAPHGLPQAASAVMSTAPFSFKQAFPPALPASTHAPHGLPQATSAIMPTTPASTYKGSSFKPSVRCDAVGVTSTVGTTPSLPSAGHTFLLGAAQAGRANFSPATGFTVLSHQCPATPTAHRVTSFSQVLPSAVQISPSRNNANLRGMGSLLPASALGTRNQPALSSGISKPTSIFTVPWGSSSKPPFPRPLGVTPQPAFGASGEQKQRAPQAALGPSFNSPFIFGNSAGLSPTQAPIPTPAQPAISSHTQLAFGALIPSASTFHVQPGFSSTPAGFLFGQASASGFGFVTQSGVCGSVFGSTAPRPFAFGGVVTPMDCGESGVSVTAPDKSSNSGMFYVGARQGGAARTVTPFGKVCSQSSQGLTSHSTPFASRRASISARKTVFRAPHMVPLAQSTPVPGPVKTGSSLGFGVPSPHAQGSVGRESFRSLAPSFSFGAKPKTPKNREQGHARRHRAHRK